MLCQHVWPSLLGDLSFPYDVFYILVCTRVCARVCAYSINGTLRNIVAVKQEPSASERQKGCQTVRRSRIVFSPVTVQTDVVQ